MEASDGASEEVSVFLQLPHFGLPLFPQDHCIRCRLHLHARRRGYNLTSLSQCLRVAVTDNELGPQSELGLSRKQERLHERPKKHTPAPRKHIRKPDESPTKAPLSYA